MTDEPVRPDAPNQQLVRPDGSHPADEGTGGGKAKRGRAASPDTADKAAERAAERRPVGRPRKTTDETDDD